MTKLTGPQRRWVAALRSKAYAQGGGRLRNLDNFCCLGVACDVHAKETGRGEWDKNEGSGRTVFRVPSDPISHPTALPVEVKTRLRLYSESGVRRDAPECPFTPSFPSSCVSANDQLGYTFDEIADMLEEKPEEFFEQLTPEQLLERLTAADLVAEVRALAAERPGVVYHPGHGCLYTMGECTDGTCGCLVGQALVSLGFPVEWLYEKLDGVSCVLSAQQAVKETFGMKFTEDEFLWLGAVQGHQDFQYTWGEAVAKADKDLGEAAHEETA